MFALSSGILCVYLVCRFRHGTLIVPKIVFIFERYCVSDRPELSFPVRDSYLWAGVNEQWPLDHSNINHPKHQNPCDDIVNAYHGHDSSCRKAKIQTLL